MIPVERVEAMIAEAVTKAVAEAVAKAVAPLLDALAQAKRTIAALQAERFGVRAETSQVVLTAEGQQFIDATWVVSQAATPAPAEPVSREVAVRTPRDRRGLAQRFPQLPIHEVDAVVPAELAAEVAAGTLLVRRSGQHHDELVVPASAPFVRRVHELELVKPSTGQALLQLTPDRIVPGGDLADETIHQIVEAKLLDALPFHRQLARLQRVGVEIPKQTINDAVNAWGDVFAPLADAIRAQVWHSAVVHADASWQRLQATGECQRLHLWTMLGDGQIAYRVTDDQTHVRASELVPAAFTGRLVTDAWPGWFTLPLGDRLSLCNAHARRPFAAWLKRDPRNPHAARIVGLYRDLARLEHADDDAPPEQRLARRRQRRDQHARPLMARLRAEAETIATAYPPTHHLADGARYLIDYWDGLTRFLDHPELPPDNNAAENALRINALIRKNSLFAGSRAAADRDAVALTILQSCRAQHLTPSDYLARVTPALLIHRRGRPQNLDRLTPAALAKNR